MTGTGDRPGLAVERQPSIRAVPLGAESALCYASLGASAEQHGFLVPKVGFEPTRAVKPNGF